MNKQKTLIFSLSALLFIATSFIAYSWTEPTTPMPSGYTAPLNTSATAQNKVGELGAASFVDADDSNYYINPSGNSVVSGTIAAANPTENNHVTTKGYIDELLGDVAQEASVSNLIYVTGTNPPCPNDSIEIIRYWTPTTCTGHLGQTCTTGGSAFFQNLSVVPTCTYPIAYNQKATCTSSGYNVSICAKLDTPLVNNFHTESQCKFLGGDVVTVEGDVSICKFYNTQTCPITWTQYENWSETLPATAPMTIIRVEPSGTSTYTGSHNWSNTPQESFFCFYGDWASCKNNECAIGYNYGCGGFDVYANMTQIGCY